MRRIPRSVIVVEVVLVTAFAAVTVWQKNSEHHTAARPDASAPGAATSSTTTATASTNPQPSTTTTTVDPVRKAGADYLEMATAAYQVHALARSQFERSNGRIAWADFPAYCAAIQGSDVVFVMRLGTHWWPPNARAAIGSLVLDTAALARLEQQCAQTPGRSFDIQPVANEIGVAMNKVMADQSAARAALGLPAAP